MLSIERLKAGDNRRYGRYRVINADRDCTTVAVVDGLEKAACLLRFLRGAHLQPAEYEYAITTMREIDAEDAARNTAEGGGKGT